MISVMTILLLIALVASVVFALEHHHRSSRGLPHPHGADSTIAFTGLDHDWERVVHDAEARHA